MTIAVRAMKGQITPGISPEVALESLSIPLRGSDGGTTTPIRADGATQSGANTACVNVAKTLLRRVQPIVKWEDFPVSVEDDTPWIQRVNLMALDDEMHTAIAWALFPRKAPTTFIGPYLPPDGKYLVARDRDRTPRCQGVIGPGGECSEWTLEKECTNSDPPEEVLPSTEHIRLVYIHRAARGQKWLGTPNYARPRASVQVW